MSSELQNFSIKFYRCGEKRISILRQLRTGLRVQISMHFQINKKCNHFRMHPIACHVPSFLVMDVLKAAAKRVQHFIHHTTLMNEMLHSFGHLVVSCCILLYEV